LILAFAFALALSAQDEIAELANEPTIGVWQKSHAQDQLELAAYSLGDRADAIDARPNRLCAISTSVSRRTALFYVPEVPAGALLPSGRIEPKAACTLQALWFETQAPLENVVRELTAKWGQPGGSAFKPEIRGAGLWKNVTAWHRPGFSIWAAYYNGVIVYARRDMPKDSAMFRGPPFRPSPVMDAAARLLGDPTPLTTEILARSRCEDLPVTREDPSKAAARLDRWLRLSSTLPGQQKAAALLLADEYVTCAENSFRSPQLDGLFKNLGAEFETQCPQNGPFYTHNFRRRAEINSELAKVVGLGDFCNLKGSHPWYQLVIDNGERILAQFPNDAWTSYVHYLVGRAHAARLAFSYPGGNPETGTIFPLSSIEKERERNAAVAHFKLFLAKQPDLPESVFAWQEAWRLMAGLPPSRLSFGCSCE
jgi:hypothetical protein